MIIMKKICFINLSLMLAISIFAQSGKETDLTAGKNDIHTRFDHRNKTGFYNIMQVSLIMGSSQSTDKTIYAMPDLTYTTSNIAPTYSYPNNTRTDLSVAPSFTITNGYRFNENWAAGAGVGFEVFDYNLFPLFAEIRYTVWDNTISPFMVLKGGYSFSSFKSKHYDNLYLNWTPYYVNNADLRQYGGLMIQPEIGVKVPINENCDVLFSAAYRYQETKSVARRVYDGGQFDEWEHNEDINRLSFGVAIMFR
jgi:hypothetical protein